MDTGQGREKRGARLKLAMSLLESVDQDRKRKEGARGLCLHNLVAVVEDQRGFPLVLIDLRKDRDRGGKCLAGDPWLNRVRLPLGLADYDREKERGREGKVIGYFF